MKYALLVHQSQEHFDRRNDASAVAAGKAYGEALQAAGIFVGGAGLDSPQNTTTVSVRDGKRQVHDGPMPKQKSSSPDLVSLTCRISMPRWNGLRGILLPDLPQSKCVPCWDRISWSELGSLPNERSRDERRH
jgi:hypothetical protein